MTNSGTLKGWALVAPALIFIILFLFYPVSSMVLLSFQDDSGFTLHRYVEALTGRTYRVVLWNTVEIALVVTSITTLAAFPVAMAMVFGPRLLSTFLIVVVGVSFWVSFVIRTYSWMVILGSNGPLKDAFLLFGVENPPRLLFTQFASTVALTHLLLPLMILILAARMQRIDWGLVTAAESLGARPWRAFTTVFLPLTMPGLVNGAVLVFVMVLGFYITPALVGAPDQIMLGQLIVMNIELLLDWGAAATQAVILMITAFALVGFFRWAVPDVEE
jgi:putative spermidine/putrescine transport system permease protein